MEKEFWSRKALFSNTLFCPMVQYCSFWHAGAPLRLSGFIPPRSFLHRFVLSGPSAPFVPSVPSVLSVLSVPLPAFRPFARTAPPGLSAWSLCRAPSFRPRRSAAGICLPSLNRPQKRPAPCGTGLVRLLLPVCTGRLYCCCLTYLSSQPKNSRFQTIEFWGLKTWCASSSNSTSRAGTPCSRAAVKASSDCV